MSILNLNLKDMTEQNKIKSLYRLCKRLGDGIHGKFSIHFAIDVFGDKVRVYHKEEDAGYCIDVEREAVCAPCEVDKCIIETAYDGFLYSYSEHHEGFDVCGLENAIKILSYECEKL